VYYGHIYYLRQLKDYSSWSVTPPVFSAPVQSLGSPLMLTYSHYPMLSHCLHSLQTWGDSICLQYMHKLILSCLFIGRYLYVSPNLKPAHPSGFQTHLPMHNLNGICTSRGHWGITATVQRFRIRLYSIIDHLC
jgi:hypothetical protein